MSSFQILLVSWVALSFTIGHALAADNDYIKVEVRGTITTGVVVIGGETTGITITAGKTTLELEIKDPELKALAEKLNGKKAVAKGILEIRPGVEVKERRIVLVSALQAAGR